MAPVVSRPSRATRGKRLSKLVDEEIEADEEFWGQDAFKEDVVDDEYEEEKEIEDEFDSDFNDDEDESDDGEVEEKERRPKKKQKLPPGGKKPHKKGPLGSAKKKEVSFLEKAAAAADAGETPLPILKTPQPAVRPSVEEKEDGETEEGEKSLRKSTRTSVIVRQAEREAQRAIQQALPKIVKKKKEGEDKKMTQEEMLLEAAQTEILNRQSLETLLAREEEVKRKAIINKEVYSGPLIRFYSKEGTNILEFIKMVDVPEVINAKALPYPRQPVCVVTGLPAKYRDPKSGLPYATKEAFAVIRERLRRGENISRKDSLEKVQRKRTKVEREKSASGSRTGSVKIKFKKPDKPGLEEAKTRNSPHPQSQRPVENRTSGGAGPSAVASSGIGTLDKPENTTRGVGTEEKVEPTPPPPPPPAPAPLPRPMVEANEADFMLEDLEVSLPSNFDSGLSIQTSGMGSAGDMGGQGGGQELQLEHELLNLSPSGPGLSRFSERYELSLDVQSNNLLLDESWLQNT